MQVDRRDFLRLASSAAATLMAMRSQAQELKLRKDVTTLSAAELSVLRTGVDAMKKLSRDNILSWDFQRGVHSIAAASPGLPDPASAVGFWRQCKHHTTHFFDWHRWELLYWEEICRQLCGTPAFTLPYWDYFSDGHLPAAFRPAAPGQPANTLAHQRNAALNNGSATIGPISAGGFGETDFFQFSSAFESNPHDAVHGYVGYDMGSVPTAALDPVFYLHHANIDRYWAKWLQQGGGRANPTGSWASTTFSFQTVSGIKTNSSGAAGTPEALGYTYDHRVRVDMSQLAEILRYLNQLKGRYKVAPVRVIPRPPPGPGPDPGPWKTLLAASGLKLDGHPVMAPIPRGGQVLGMLTQALSAKDADLVLTLRNIQSTKFAALGGYIYQIYLVPSAAELGNGATKEAAEVGSFSAFSVSAAEQHHEHGHDDASSPPQLQFKLSMPARKILEGSAKRDPAFVFVRRGLVSNGKEIQEHMDDAFFTIDGLSIDAKRSGES